MSLEKDLKTILESIGGSGTFPTGGFKLDPATGFAQDRRRKTGSVTVPTPASAGDLKPAGYDTHNILGRSVKIPRFDDYDYYHGKMKEPVDDESQSLAGDFVDAATGVGQYLKRFFQYVVGADPKAAEKEAEEELRQRQSLGDRPGGMYVPKPASTKTAPTTTSNDQRSREMTDSEGNKYRLVNGEYKLVYIKPKGPQESYKRREEIKNIINEQAAGRAVSSLSNLIPGQGILGKGLNLAFGYSLIQDLLGASDEQMTDLFGTGISTTPRGPEGVLAKTRKLKARTGGELSQEGPRSKRIKNKVKGTLETRRSKERAARKK